MLRRVSQLVVAPLVAALVFPIPARATDHLVSGAEIASRLGQAAKARQADLADVQAFLASPVGVQAARTLGTSTAALESRLAHLSDAEARDLARRARELTTDPAAGLSSGAIVAIVLGGVALTVLLIWALAEAEEDLYDYY